MSRFSSEARFAEVAVALGYQKGEVDDVIKKLPHFFRCGRFRREIQSSPETRTLLGWETFRDNSALCRTYRGIPQAYGNSSVWSGDSPEPISCYMPLQRGDKGLPITQWSMYPVKSGSSQNWYSGSKGLEVISNTIRAVRTQVFHPWGSQDVSQRHACLDTGCEAGKPSDVFILERSSDDQHTWFTRARWWWFWVLTAYLPIIRPEFPTMVEKIRIWEGIWNWEPEDSPPSMLKPILLWNQRLSDLQGTGHTIASELAWIVTSGQRMICEG